jgi:hypothetical protein
MKRGLKLDILPQPDDHSCGPTCLHALYGYYGDEISLDQVVKETAFLEEGGTLAPLLGCHALRRGYRAKIYTWDLQVFDPTWFKHENPPLVEKLAAQMAVKEGAKLLITSQAYLDFLRLGGQIRIEDLTVSLIRRYLKQQTPILAGLSATYLYQTAREYGPKWDPDDVRGIPAGHFVVLCGYDKRTRNVLVADPLKQNPFGTETRYLINIDRVLCAILLGILTHDAKLLIVEPSKPQKRNASVDPDRRE